MRPVVKLLLPLVVISRNSNTSIAMVFIVIIFIIYQIKSDSFIAGPHFDKSV